MDWLVHWYFAFCLLHVTSSTTGKCGNTNETKHEVTIPVQYHSSQDFKDYYWLKGCSTSSTSICRLSFNNDGTDASILWLKRLLMLCFFQAILATNLI